MVGEPDKPSRAPFLVISSRHHGRPRPVEEEWRVDPGEKPPSGASSHRHDLTSAAPSSHPPMTERNATELTTAEFMSRLPCELNGPTLDKHTQRAVMMLWCATTPKDVELCENNTPGHHCGHATYRYRWIVNESMVAWGLRREAPSPWYCVCGYEIGAP